MTINNDYTTQSFFKNYCNDLYNYLIDIEGNITVYYDFYSCNAIVYIKGNIEDSKTNLKKLLSLSDRDDIEIHIIQRYQQLWLPFDL